MSEESQEILDNARADYRAGAITYEQYADIVFSVMRAEVEADYDTQG